MKQKKKIIRRISHTMKVLLEGIGETLYWTSPRGLAYATIYGGHEREGMKRIRREELRRQRALYELRRRKLIKTVNKGGRLIVALTEKGFHVALPYQMRVAPQCPNNEYVVVTFDIPETRRDVRWILRHLLKANKFRMLHQSVWYTDRDVLDLLREWVRQTHADPWVYVFRATDIKIDRLKKEK